MVYLSIYFDVNNTGLSILTLIIWDIALDYKYTYGAVYAFIGYLAYMSTSNRTQASLLLQQLNKE